MVCPKAPGDPTYYRLRRSRSLQVPTVHAGNVERLLRPGIRVLVHHDIGAQPPGQPSWSRFDVVQSCNPPDIFWPIGVLFRSSQGSPLCIRPPRPVPRVLLEFRFPEGIRLLYRRFGFIERWTARGGDQVISTNGSYRAVVIERHGLSPRASPWSAQAGPPASSLLVPTRPACAAGSPWPLTSGVMGPQDCGHRPRGGGSLSTSWADRRGFTLIGSGDCFNELVAYERAARPRRLRRVHGRIPDATSAAILSSADVGISPDPKSR